MKVHDEAWPVTFGPTPARQAITAGVCLVRTIAASHAGFGLPGLTRRHARRGNKEGGGWNAE